MMERASFCNKKSYLFINFLFSSIYDLSFPKFSGNIDEEQSNGMYFAAGPVKDIFPVVCVITFQNGLSDKIFSMENFLLKKVVVSV